MMVCIQTEDQQAAKGAISRREPKRPFPVDRLSTPAGQRKCSLSTMQASCTGCHAPSPAPPCLPSASIGLSLLSGHFAAVSSSSPPISRHWASLFPLGHHARGAIPSPCSGTAPVPPALSPSEVMCCPHREGGGSGQGESESEQNLAQASHTWTTSHPSVQTPIAHKGGD